MGGGSRAVLETRGELGKSQATKYESSIGNVPQPREALTQGIFPLKLLFAYLQPALAQMSRGTQDDCKPVVMEMPVALRSASALGSLQTHFRFRRLGTITTVLLTIQGYQEGVPTNRVTGPGCGAIDCRDEADRCCRWWLALKFQTIFQFPFSLCKSKALYLNVIRAFYV